MLTSYFSCFAVFSVRFCCVFHFHGKHDGKDFVVGPNLEQCHGVELDVVMPWHGGADVAGWYSSAVAVAVAVALALALALAFGIGIGIGIVNRQQHTRDFVQHEFLCFVCVCVCVFFFSR